MKKYMVVVGILFAITISVSILLKDYPREPEIITNDTLWKTITQFKDDPQCFSVREIKHRGEDIIYVECVDQESEK